MKKYIVRDRQSGWQIDAFDSKGAAIEAINDYETEDKACGTYEEDFYEVACWNQNDEVYESVL